MCIVLFVLCYLAQVITVHYADMYYECDHVRQDYETALHHRLTVLRYVPSCRVHPRQCVMYVALTSFMHCALTRTCSITYCLH